MVEFTPNTMEKLAELLKVPEPDVLQGDDMITSGELSILQLNTLFILSIYNIP